MGILLVVTVELNLLPAHEQYSAAIEEVPSATFTFYTAVSTLSLIGTVFYFLAAGFLLFPLTHLS